HARELLHRLGKAHPRLLGEEPEMVAGHPTAEAVIDALAVVGVKTRALFAVERAARPHIPPARLAFPLVPYDVLTHHLRNRQALAYLVEEAVRKAHGLPNPR